MEGSAEYELTPCHYCGIVADSVDHVPPSVARPHIIAFGLLGYYRFTTVPACRECNSALNHLAPWTLGARKEWVKRWLRQRYAKYLRIPDWQEEEIKKKGPTLQRYIRDGLEIRNLTRKRIQW